MLRNIKRRAAAPQCVSGDAPESVRRQAVAPDRRVLPAADGARQADQVGGDADGSKGCFPVPITIQHHATAGAESESGLGRVSARRAHQRCRGQRGGEEASHRPCPAAGQRSPQTSGRHRTTERGTRRHRALPQGRRRRLKEHVQGARPNTRVPLVPPKPNEFFSA